MHHFTMFKRVVASRMWRCGVVAVVLVWLSGCATSSKPRALLHFQLAPETIPLAAVDDNWAVLQWAATHEDELGPYDRSAMMTRMNLAGLLIFDRWARDVVADYPFLGFVDGDIVIVSPPADNRIAQEALNTLKAPIRVRPNVDRIMAFQWAENLERSGFSAWVNRTGFIELPKDTYGNTSATVAVLQRRLHARVIDEAVQKVALEIAAGRYDRARELLVAELRNYPGDPELTAQLNGIYALQIKQELATIQSGSLARATAAGGAQAVARITDVEADLEARSREWRQSAQMAAAFEQVQPEFKALQREIAVVRGNLWQQELTDLAGKRQFWQAYQVAKTRLDAAQRYPVAMAVVLEGRLWTAYLDMLPDAYRVMLDLGQQEMVDAERYGTTLLLCDMLAEMTTFALDHDQTLPPVLQASMARSQDFSQQATTFFNNWVNRRIVIQEFTSGDPGLGTTIVRDLENLLSVQLGDNTLLYGVSMAPYGHQPTASDYVIEKGHVAAFSVNTTAPKTSIELIRRRGPIAIGLNPEYEARMKKNKGVHGIAPKVLLQEVSEYTLHRSVVRSVAHARITYTIAHKGARPFHEINQFLEKEFIQESIDPRETKVTQTVVSSRNAPQEPEPTLQHETVWVESKMKDWARRENEKLVAMQLQRYVAGYPNQLADAARAHEAKKEWKMAANFWGFCQAYCRRITPRPDVARARAQAETTSHLKPELDADADLHSALFSLQQQVREKAIASALRLLDSAR